MKTTTELDGICKDLKDLAEKDKISELIEKLKNYVEWELLLIKARKKADRDNTHTQSLLNFIEAELERRAYQDSLSKAKRSLCLSIVGLLVSIGALVISFLNLLCK